MPVTQTAPVEATAPLLSSSARREYRIVWFTIGVTAATLLLAAGPAIDDRSRPRIFEFLFRTQEPIAAWISGALLLFALAASRSAGGWRRAMTRLALSPHLFIASVTLVCAAAALVVYRAHPLSMDEYAPLFQARAFAAGALAGKVPPELVDRLIPMPRWVLDASPDGRVVSAYWPGFAVLLTPFALLHVPWLLNPLLAGASLYLLWWLALRACPAPE
ncbi:MAG TPA: hypothetical protein VG496_16965, partial [Myxococcales bacterium]|nr:hypothetical protein [Myxococcales bacterium]